LKVHLIKSTTLVEYAKKHASGTSSFNQWISKVKRADWEKPQDMLDTFNSVDLLGKGCSRAVFDIGGNDYRLICSYHFGKTMVHLFVKWIGTHAEYEELCKMNRQYTVDHY